MYNIDWDFIQKLEGFELQGYVPRDCEGGVESGVTIASGFDIGQRDSEEIRRLFRDHLELCGKLIPFAGLRGKEAHKSPYHTLIVTEDEAAIINQVAKEQTLSRLSQDFNRTSSVRFQDLSREQQTVMASVAFQYGSLRTKTPNFWRQCLEGRWEDAYNNLMDFKDKYPRRRRLEAKFLKGE